MDIKQINQAIMFSDLTNDELMSVIDAVNDRCGQVEAGHYCQADQSLFESGRQRELHI